MTLEDLYADKIKALTQERDALREQNKALERSLEAEQINHTFCVAEGDRYMEALKLVDIYFKALCEQWLANDGRVVSESGVVINASASVQTLCERAAEAVQSALHPEEKK